MTDLLIETVAALLLSLVGGSVPADPAIAGEITRLEGQRYTVAPDGQSYRIDDIAGEGAPLVGVVERRGARLWLVDEAGDAVRLRGPLAIPRIAGPGYKVWVMGDGDPLGGELTVRRLGVLRGPAR
jgi:hypothetical protein